jgi:nitrogen fixation/metabolism regulation signal transduction histidine kinase
LWGLTTFRFNYLKIAEPVKRLRDKSDMIATSDTNSMSEQDMKKWHIDELKIALETMIDRLDSNRRQLRRRAELVENLFTTWSNVVLGGVSFVAPAILGLSSVVGVLKEFMRQLRLLLIYLSV